MKKWLTAVDINRRDAAKAPALAHDDAEVLVTQLERATRSGPNDGHLVGVVFQQRNRQLKVCTVAQKARTIPRTIVIILRPRLGRFQVKFAFGSEGRKQFPEVSVHKTVVQG